MILAIRGGHTKTSYGAVDVLDEYIEDRKIYKRVIELLKEYHTIIDCTPDDSYGNGEWNVGVQKANSSNIDLFFSIHFNSASGDPQGTEVCVYNTTGTAAEYGKRVSSNIASLGFKNRGLKKRTDLAETANIIKPSMIIEVCFVQKSDAELYKSVGVEKIARAIANAIDNRISLDVSNTNSSSSSSNSTGSKTSNFINKLAPLAVADYKISKVLPSLTIAQSILESGWGESELAVKANNLFGIKADARWSGKVYSTETKEYYDSSNTPTTITTNFRAYDNWEGGIKDHSEFLQADRYSKVINAKDYKTACEEGYKAGYATDPNYTSKLIKLIEDYKLYEYDTTNTSSNTSSTTTPELYRVRKSWSDIVSQKGAFSVLENAIAECKKYSDYKVYNSSGAQVYPEIQTVDNEQIISRYKENGKATVVVNSLNVRDNPHTKNSNIVASYSKNESFYYNEVYISNAYVWVSYISNSGYRRYVAVKNKTTGERYANCV